MAASTLFSIWSAVAVSRWSAWRSPSHCSIVAAERMVP